MSYAIIQASGKQLWVEPGLFYDVDRIKADPGDSIFFERILLVNDKDKIYIGKPCVDAAKVKAVVLRHLKGKKIIVYKMKPKKGTRLKQGHRQELTRLMIESIFLQESIITAST
uniref:ribosomal protein L21 n=1 Tax=Timspurckia oligopyrenoides TaxID=708627 RepID=UPI001FCCDFD6|nr:ribosomal protein L21 [Timspurckia oligopyrenoides]UNJ17587.1 ribosomal protein L21 [Timspurckia oligopyrenoides]